jgi:hypothetical protein
MSNSQQFERIDSWGHKDANKKDSSLFGPGNLFLSTQPGNSFGEFFLINQMSPLFGSSKFFA